MTMQGQGGAGSEHSCPRCGVFFGTYMAGATAVAVRCAACGYTVEPHSHSTAPLPAALDSGLRYWVDRGLRYWVDRGIVNPAVIEGQGGAGPAAELTCPTCGCFIGQRIETGVVTTRCQQCAPETVPDDAGERTLLSLQSRWAHAECSREQVAAEALAVIRQLTLDACADRVRLTTKVAALSALAETILQPPPDVQQVYDLQNRLVQHTDELDRVLGQADRGLLNWTLGSVCMMHVRIQKLASGQAADDLLRTLERQNDNQAERIRELEKHTMCWHCHDVLTPDEPPHCQACPAFACCDVRNCPQPGCEERMGWPGDE
jgi:hypothetical protein